MYWLYFVLLSLVVHGTAAEIPVGNSGTYTIEADVKKDDRTALSHEPLRQLVESLLERVEGQEIRLQQMEKTMEENVEDLKHKDIRIENLERELNEMKTESYQLQPPVDTRQQSETPEYDIKPEDYDHNIGSDDQDHAINPEDQDHDINPDSFQEQHESKTNGITSRQKTKYEQPLRSVAKRVSPPTSREVGAFSVSLSKNMDLHPGLILKFDEILLDIGGNYNKGDGVYTVPVGGVYVFTWIITGSTIVDLVTELVINGSPRGIVFSDGDNTHWDSATGLIVTPVSAGDHVFIRSKYAGTLRSANTHTKAMFSGWRLS